MSCGANTLVREIWGASSPNSDIGIGIAPGIINIVIPTRQSAWRDLLLYLDMVEKNAD